MRAARDGCVEHAVGPTKVLKHFGGTVASEAILVVEVAHEHGRHVRAQGDEGFSCCEANPPLIVREKRRHTLGVHRAAERTERTRRMSFDDPALVLKQRQQDGRGFRPSESAQRLGYGFSDTFVVVSRKIGHDRLEPHFVPVARQERDAPKAKPGVRRSEKRQNLPRDGKRKVVECGRDSGGRVSLLPQRLDEGLRRTCIWKAPRQGNGGADGIAVTAGERVIQKFQRAVVTRVEENVKRGHLLPFTDATGSFDIGTEAGLFDEVRGDDGRDPSGRRAVRSDPLEDAPWQAFQILQLSSKLMILRKSLDRAAHSSFGPLVDKTLEDHEEREDEP